MKYLHVALFCIFASSLFGQLKESKNTATTEPIKNITIDVPSFKLHKGSTNETSPRFVPISGTSLKGVFDDKGKVLSISGEFKARASQSIQAVTRNILTRHASAICENRKVDYRLVSGDTDRLGMQHYKYALMYKGIELHNKEVIVHLDKGNYFINGSPVGTLEDIDISANLSADSALEIAKKDIGEIVPIPRDFELFDAMQDISKLVVHIGDDGKPVLAYYQLVYKNLVERWEVLVDAKTGDVIRKNLAMCKFHNTTHRGHAHTSSCRHAHTPAHKDVSRNTEASNGPVVSRAEDLFGTVRNINTYQSGGTYYMIDAARSMFNNANSTMPNNPVGSIWTIDALNQNPRSSNFSYDHVKSGNQSFYGKKNAVSAHYNGGLAYEYFKNVHGRESINGSGGNILAFVNVTDQNGNSMGNAFWNGVALFYGNGNSAFKPLARGLDVAGHEMSHGVIQKTANLTYYGESGALNESFADIFGVMIDRDNWQVGEDVVNKGAFPSGALRSMSDPHNGAQTGQFNKGWQPRVYSERYTGSEDNAGVHINSGIPNYAFYLFATNAAVGKDKAERVYYRALTKYLTKSSQFADARVAVVKAAKDLYGQAVANAANQAFDKVGINPGSGDYQKDIDVNTGSDLILFTPDNGDGLYIANTEGELVFGGKLSEQKVSSVPSITDDGSEVVFVNGQKELVYIRIDWSNKTKRESVLNNTVKWRGASFSKDGRRIAAVQASLKPEIFVYDFKLNEGKTYQLSNPTYTEGVETGDVQYADAMEFDFTGEYVMYDAINKLKGNNSNVEYWDIGFLKVFSNSSNTFEASSRISKLFNNLDNGVSIGNPTFSKNSPYIIAFDYVKQNDFVVLGANIETNTVRIIYDTENTTPSYPSYATKDDVVIFSYKHQGKGIIVGIRLKTNKIEGKDKAGSVLNYTDTGIKWGRWFNNGSRDIVSTENAIANAVTVYPVPAKAYITIDNTLQSDLRYAITSMDGKELTRGNVGSGKNRIGVEGLRDGMYILSLHNEATNYSRLIIINE